MKFRIDRASGPKYVRDASGRWTPVYESPCEGAIDEGDAAEGEPLYVLDVADLEALLELARRVGAPLIMRAEGPELRLTIYDDFLE